jgi:peptidoglycan/LPS O-acetylase OafA/YrhL
VVAFSLIIFGAARPAGAMTMLAVPAMVLLGEASYSIYILHVPLRLWWDGLGLGLPLWLNLALYILLLVTFSILSFRCIETPMRKRIARSSLTGFRVRACRPDLRPLSGRPQ